MTWAERTSIIAKDVLTNQDIGRLLDLNESDASRIAMAIRRWAKDNGTLRLDIRGKIHIEDYIDYFRLPRDRFFMSEGGNG